MTPELAAWIADLLRVEAVAMSLLSVLGAVVLVGILVPFHESVPAFQKMSDRTAGRLEKLAFRALWVSVWLGITYILQVATLYFLCR